MSGKGAELGLGSTAAVAGGALSLMGMPEVGLPLLMGGVGMDTGDAIKGPMAGLMGGAAGGAAGMGASALGAGSLIPSTAFSQMGEAGAAPAAAATAPGAAAQPSMTAQLESEAIKTGIPEAAKLASNTLEQPAPPPTPPQPQNPKPPPQNPATGEGMGQNQQTATNMPEPMNTLSQYHQFISNPFGTA
jgi:hypothetical protein